MKENYSTLVQALRPANVSRAEPPAPSGLSLNSWTPSPPTFSPPTPSPPTPSPSSPSPPSPLPPTPSPSTPSPPTPSSSASPPIIPSLLIQLSRDHYPAVRYWTRDEWNTAQKDIDTTEPTQPSGSHAGSGKVGNVKMGFVEDENDVSIDGPKAVDIRARCREIWQNLRSRGLAPAKWGEATPQVDDYYRSQMHSGYPELRLCENHWKVDCIAAIYYTKWYARRRSRAEPSDASALDRATPATPATSGNNTGTMIDNFHPTPNASYIHAEASTDSSGILPTHVPPLPAGPSGDHIEPSTSAPFSLSPTYSELLAPLSRDDYPAVRFWTRDEWNIWEAEAGVAAEPVQTTEPGVRRRGRTRAANGENVTLQFVEDEDGISVSGYAATAIRSRCRQIWHQLLLHSLAPARWGDATTDSCDFYRSEMYTEFPELRLCEKHWKVDLVALLNYPNWWGRVTGKYPSGKKGTTAETAQPNPPLLSQVTGGITTDHASESPVPTPTAVDGSAQLSITPGANTSRPPTAVASRLLPLSASASPLGLASNYLELLAPLLRNNYPAVRHWTREGWNSSQEAAGSSAPTKETQKQARQRAAKGANVTMQFVERENGVVISGAGAGKIRIKCREVWQKLLNHGLAPVKWGDAAIDACNYYRSEMYAAYPELRLCGRHWKVDYIAYCIYSSWYAWITGKKSAPVGARPSAAPGIVAVQPIDIDGAGSANADPGAALASSAGNAGSTDTEGSWIMYPTPHSLSARNLFAVDFCKENPTGTNAQFEEQWRGIDPQTLKRYQNLSKKRRIEGKANGGEQTLTTEATGSI
ncbi:hypothetical protein BOTBODRAFT_59750 [Botryobasidium botryosum FD-172 SS1]|uniref:Uncharacterized protein n=1 Tax=Botryobasidium botryosum (strain FD-172 SS1) TaxID=930990 RepID=A0A067M7M0_BOTB1|nr:hypothetical protein BOTBODRAFT_59750 [Botryobasidium botryosum FD-172 SS1]